MVPFPPESLGIAWGPSVVEIAIEMFGLGTPAL